MPSHGVFLPFPIHTYARYSPIMPENPLFYSSSSEVIHTRKDDSLPNTKIIIKPAVCSLSNMQASAMHCSEP